jgi:hypothetical protein
MRSKTRPATAVPVSGIGEYAMPLNDRMFRNH